MISRKVIEARIEAEIYRGREIAAKNRRRALLDAYAHVLVASPAMSPDLYRDGKVQMGVYPYSYPSEPIWIEAREDFPSEECVARVILWAQANGETPWFTSTDEHDHTYRDQMQRRYREATGE